MRSVRPPDLTPPSPLSAADQPDVGFVACIEGGVLEQQTLLLFESIRQHTGRFRNCPLYALSPRVGHAISVEARKKLDELEAYYVDTILHDDCPEYGSANRVAAGAYIEDTRQHDVLVVLDSDTLFLREPSEFILPDDIDVLVRPVDVKGISTGGPGDSSDKYWQELCRSAGIDYDLIPWTRTFVDRQRIKANYNGGLAVVRGGLGILRRAADIFFASVRQGLRPDTEGNSFRAGAGWVEPQGAHWWGTSQAALSLGIWSTTQRAGELPPTYNYPLNLHSQIDRASARAVFPHLVHVHYHWMFAPDALSANPLFLRSGPLSAAQRDWLRSATPIG